MVSVIDGLEIAIQIGVSIAIACVVVLPIFAIIYFFKWLKARKRIKQNELKINEDFKQLKGGIEKYEQKDKEIIRERRGKRIFGDDEIRSLADSNYRRPTTPDNERRGITVNDGQKRQLSNLHDSEFTSNQRDIEQDWENFD